MKAREQKGNAQPAGKAPDRSRGLSEAKRRDRIAVAAYYNAERRGFAQGRELEDWLEAEKQVKTLDERQRRRHAGLERAPDGEETSGPLAPADLLPRADGPEGRRRTNVDQPGTQARRPRTRSKNSKRA
jgi:hypothetical protein